MEIFDDLDLRSAWEDRRIDEDIVHVLHRFCADRNGRNQEDQNGPNQRRNYVFRIWVAHGGATLLVGAAALHVNQLVEHSEKFGVVVATRH